MGAVRAVAQSPARVRHDFAARGACAAELRLGLRSCLPAPAAVTVSTGAGADTGARRQWCAETDVNSPAGL